MENSKISPPESGVLGQVLDTKHVMGVIQELNDYANYIICAY